MFQPLFTKEQGIEVRVAFVISCLLMAAFFVSPALMSLSVAGLLLVGIFSVRSFWKEVAGNPFLAVVAGLFGILLILHAMGWAVSDDTQEAQRKFLLKIPFLLSPFLWGVFRKFTLQQRIAVLLVFIFFVYMAGTVSVLVYFRNQDFFDPLILQAKPVPILFGYGVHHIQFSILNALACFSGAYVLLAHRDILGTRLSLLLLLFTVLNVVNLHILSARTGLLSFYAGTATSLLLYVVMTGKSRYLRLFPLLLLLPLVAYWLSGSLQNRVANSLEDWDTIVHAKDPNDRSVAMRVEAWKAAIELIREHPLRGVGLGDVDTEMQRQYAESQTVLEEQNRKNPHNQFLETALHTGILGALALFLVFVFYMRASRRNVAHIGVLVIWLVSLFFESMLERQISVAAMGFFMGFFVFMNNPEKEE